MKSDDTGQYPSICLTRDREGRQMEEQCLQSTHLFMLPEITWTLLIFLGLPVNVNETAPLAQTEAEDVLGITGDDRQISG